MKNLINLRVRSNNVRLAIRAFNSRNIPFEIIREDTLIRDEDGLVDIGSTRLLNNGDYALFTDFRVATDMTQFEISQLFAEFGFGTLARGGDANSPNLKN